jgi:hypothetical protein
MVVIFIETDGIEKLSHKYAHLSTRFTLVNVVHFVILFSVIFFTHTIFDPTFLYVKTRNVKFNVSYKNLNYYGLKYCNINIVSFQ